VLKAEPRILGSTLFYKLKKRVEVFKYGQLPSKSGIVHGESCSMHWKPVKVRAGSSLIRRDLELSSKTSSTVSNTILT
jgi:hypothetical protein